MSNKFFDQNELEAKVPFKEEDENGAVLPQDEGLEGAEEAPVKKEKVVKEGNVLNGPNEHEGNPENPNDLKRLIKAKAAKEAVTETRACADCQGDGKWDGVICKVCHGSGKIFKDGVVVLTASGATFVADKGELKV